MPLPTILTSGSLFHPASSEVPIDYITRWVQSHMNGTGVKNRVLMLKAKTASGKSTALPAELYLRLIHQKNTSGGILCTQPRVLTTIRTPLEIIYNSSAAYKKIFTLGQNIGYTTRFNRLKPHSGASLTFATAPTFGMYLRNLPAEYIMRKFRYILIDEVHERDMGTDVMIYMIYQFLKQHANNPACPLFIFMSATFDESELLRYFNVPWETNYIQVEGAVYPITELWDLQHPGNYVNAAAQTIENLCNTSDTTDILVFMPGLAEITQLRQLLQTLQSKLADADKPVPNILAIDSEAQRTENVDYRLLDIPLNRQIITVNRKKIVPSRRIIIATNVAETGLTLSDLGHVIDCGLSRELEYDPLINTHSLITKPAPQARIMQRRGRVGRKMPGTFIPLYSRQLFDALPVQQKPNIATQDITDVLLTIVRQTPNFDSANLEMLSLPSGDGIASAIQTCNWLGLLDIAPNIQLTKMGELVEQIGMPPMVGRMILSSWFWRVMPADVITCAAYVMFDSKGWLIDSKKPINWFEVYRIGVPPFLRGDKLLARIKFLIADDFIDGLILYYAAQSFVSNANLTEAYIAIREWCELANINIDKLMSFIGFRDDILEQYLQLSYNIYTDLTGWGGLSDYDFMEFIVKMKHCIYDGFGRHVLEWRDGNYKTIHGYIVETPNYCAGATEINIIDHPKFVLYDKLRIKLNKKTNIYKITCNKISVMDGFVNVE